MQKKSLAERFAPIYIYRLVGWLLVGRLADPIYIKERVHARTKKN